VGCGEAKCRQKAYLPVDGNYHVFCPIFNQLISKTGIPRNPQIEALARGSRTDHRHIVHLGIGVGKRPETIRISLSPQQARSVQRVCSAAFVLFVMSNLSDWCESMFHVDRRATFFSNFG
jgi:hypothetical protein